MFLDFHESTFQSGAWTDLSKEATVFSPETLARAILSYDVIKYVAKSIRGEYEYKANFEVLCDRVHRLVEQGLNDAHGAWNEVEAIDLLKYVKSQKRLSRKSRKAKGVSAQTATEEVVPLPNLEKPEVA